MTARLLTLVALTLTLAAPSAMAATPDDLALFKKVQDQVLRYPQFSIFDSVHASIADGVVELTGKVTMPYKRDAIERRVSQTPGVRAVRSRITVLPVSRMDDELRVSVARAIYGNVNFWGYGSMANPPIHVIVEHGRLTLEGVVRSEGDRVIAQSIAAGFPSFAFRNELKTDAEMRQELERL